MTVPDYIATKCAGKHINISRAGRKFYVEADGFTVGDSHKTKRGAFDFCRRHGVAVDTYRGKAVKPVRRRVTTPQDDTPSIEWNGWNRPGSYCPRARLDRL